MKLKQYKPKGHNLIIEEYTEELKQGKLYLPNQRETGIPLGRVLAVGSLCDGIKVGDIVALDHYDQQKAFTFSDHPGFCYSLNQHIVIGVFSNDSV